MFFYVFFFFFLYNTVLLQIPWLNYSQSSKTWLIQGYSRIACDSERDIA